MHSMAEVTYTHWAKATGDNDHYDCVQMTKDNDFKWSDTDCVFTKASPICEKNIDHVQAGADKDHAEMEGESLYLEFIVSCFKGYK